MPLVCTDNSDNTSVATSITQLPPPPPGYGCSGCVIQAHPKTFSFRKEDLSSWTSVIQTVTLLTKTISYYTGMPSALQTVVTEVETLNPQTTLTDASCGIITYTTPVFTVEPTPGVTLELPSGTYLFYDKIFGGFNELATYGTAETVMYPVPTASGGSPHILRNIGTRPTCVPDVKPLEDAMPSRTEDWRSFYQSVNGTMSSGSAVPVPFAFVNYLNQDLELRSSFGGENLFSCTHISTTAAGGTPSSVVPAPEPPRPIGTTSQYTYIRTTYQPTTTQITVPGCLRCDTGASAEKTRIQNFPGGHDKVFKPTDKPNGQLTGANRFISIGTKTYEVHPATPSNQGHGSGSGQGVVVGTVTFQPGDTTVMDNVVIAIPAAGSGNVVVIGTNSYQVLPTGLPVLSVGDTMLTPNSQGQYMVGTQTLSPGGLPITANGYTLSLGSDGSRAVVNGVTQTLGSSGAPVLTIGDRMITATVVDGTTEFVVGPGQTLLPGNSIMLSGTTYFMPSDAPGTIIVINGVTSTLGPGPLTAAPDITIAGTIYAATTRDGTTEYVLGPGTTLRPGEVVTVSGTTYSLDALNTNLVVNGQTSTIAKVPASNSAIPTPSASVTAPSDGGNFVETAVSTSSKGSAVSTRRASFGVWFESFVVGLTSWIVMFL
jgi:hypothetical protein